MVLGQQAVMAVLMRVCLFCLMRTGNLTTPTRVLLTQLCMKKMRTVVKKPASTALKSKF
jgi:hypothetical protein